MFGLPRVIFNAGRSVGAGLVNKTVSSLRLLRVSRHLTGAITTFPKMAYSTVDRGNPNKDNFRVYFRNADGAAVSPLHDIPLHVDKEKGVFNMVVEIPRWSNAKMEICKEEALNPIKQDIKKGKLRFVKNIFPHKGYIWNYGALPQTYEDPTFETPDTGTKGDSDPIDVCEIGFKIHERGAVVQVKAVGIMCLIDEGETDWKVLAIDVTDPKAESINDVEDIEKNFPGLLKATYEWFKYYKVPDDKPENQFAFDGEAKDKAYTLKVIEETNEQWKELTSKEGENSINRTNVSVEGSPFKVEAAAADKIIEESAAPGPGEPESQEINKWYYVIPQQ